MGLAFLLVSAIAAATAYAGDEDCYAIDVAPYSPSGVAGCTLDGPTDGRASWYAGAVAAANWCTWPWTRCGSVRVESHATGLVITVPVAMYCDCWWTTDRRLVDLTQGQVHALGLDPADGTYAVTVTPIAQPGEGRVQGAPPPASPRLPDTAMAA